MALSAPEREFLRLAALGDPDWATMQVLLSRNFDLQQMIATAGLHQLDGVVAWRLLDERVIGHVPQSIRDYCQDHLGWLNKQRGTWMGLAKQLVEVIAGFDQPWYYWGFPTSYGLYGIDPEQWPRVATGTEFYVWGVTPDELAQALKGIGTIEILAQEGRGLVLVLSGIEHWFLCLSSKWEESHDYLRADDFWIEQIKEVAVYGVPLQVLPLEAQLLVRGLKIMGALSGGSPLSLGEFAHIANLAMSDGFDWGLAATFVNRLFEKHETIRTNLPAYVALMTDPLNEAIGPGPDDLVAIKAWPAMTAIAQILWAWEATDQVFSCFPNGWLTTIRENTIGDTAPVLHADLNDRRARPLPVLLKTPVITQTETLLFDLYNRSNVRARLADGIFLCPHSRGDKTEQWLTRIATPCSQTRTNSL